MQMQTSQKNEANETDGLYCRVVDVMLICSAKISEHKRSISPFSFYGQLPTISHTCQLYLP